MPPYNWSQIFSHPKSLAGVVPYSGPRAPEPLPAIIRLPSSRVGSNTTCNILHQEIEMTVTTYPDRPTQIFQGSPILELPAQARLTWEFFTYIQPKKYPVNVVSFLTYSRYILSFSKLLEYYILPP